MDVLPLMKRDKLTQDDFWPSAVKAYTYKGGYFGLPTSSSSNALYYNKEHFRQAGLPFPEELEKQGRWTWDALLETARRLTRARAGRGKKRFGFLRPTGLVLTVQYMWQNGGTPFSEDRTQCLLTSTSASGRCSSSPTWSLKHQVSPGATPSRTPPTTAPTSASPWSRPGATCSRRPCRGCSPGAIDPGMVVAPKGPKKDTTRGDDLAASILKTTKVLEAAWAFAKLLGVRRGAADRAQVQPQLHLAALHRPQPGHPQAGALPWEDGETYFTGLQPHGRLPGHPEVHPPGAGHLRPRGARWPTPGRRRCAPRMDSACQEIAPLLKEPF